MKKPNSQLLILLGGLSILASCTPVKEYQKGKLNDSEMVLSNRKIQKTENSFQTYREGASGANGGKTGGGCGCN
ncbi:DUF4266 domain-containing protein [Flavobacterium caeni]|uniref:DUF4266 domain-containing protein n=1 Tax=Flavobacterium caeni TaxID=490189 RepID=A0A1G5E567_9FLAO|nr:DUF4266 domain-containing protein [Flavobacterium caeni]SCY22173.1 protein of unknown function [Flavobacterium caeni]